MKGIILAGGRATRLRPLTKVTSKQLLPIYNKPMIYYPIETLVRAGVTEILVIVSPEFAGHFLHLLGTGKDLGARLSYIVQEEPNGLPEAFILGADFIDSDDAVLILGDNIFDQDFSESVQTFKSGGRIFAKEVPDPERYGVVEFDDKGKVLSIAEKPKQPKSKYALVGLYMYDNRVVELARGLKPSARGELEITDLHRAYLELGELDVVKFDGVWEDAGTFDSLLRANNIMAERAKRELVG